jgi:hypothetical protein
MDISLELLEKQVNAAWRIDHSGQFPDSVETLNITLSVHIDYKNSDGTNVTFVRIGSIPQKYHAYINRVSYGSACPAPDDKNDAFWTYDINRWLRSIGVQPVFTLPTSE